MIISSDHTIHKENRHFGWDASLAPALTVAPGSVVTFEVPDASGGQFTPQSRAEDIAALDFTRVNPVTGPVRVEGAVRGDALKITLLGFELIDWGWTAIIPGFGLLADFFPDPALYIWRFPPEPGALAVYGPGGRVPLRPFPGTIGLAPAAPGRHEVINPRRVGGNLDTRDLTEGAVLYLPVEADGGLLSIGDGHVAQGDGEVCGTAIESPFRLTVKLELEKGGAPPYPRFTTPGPVTRHIDAKGYEATTGVGPDLMASARAAVSAMIDLISGRYGMTAAEAYMLCSVCADLRITEIVDAPNWVVACYFPLSVVSG
jgi:acetamidase/formamidase